MYDQFSFIQSRKLSVHLDKNLQDCYQYDFDWSFLPDSLRKVSLLLIPFAPFFYYKYWMFLNLKVIFFQTCSFFAKALKQQDTYILFGLIVLSSFCMGHACVNVQNTFWKEPVIIWIASIITTGTYLLSVGNLQLRWTKPEQILELNTSPNLVLK